MTWGFPYSGGDSSEVQDQLKGVQQVQATSEAFAAILADGSIVTWGRPDSGGDSCEVQDQLKGVYTCTCFMFVLRGFILFRGNHFGSKTYICVLS